MVQLVTIDVNTGWDKKLAVKLLLICFACGFRISQVAARIELAAPCY